MTKANRKVLLLVDNCMAHKNPTSLKSIKIQFLPPNATSKLQPLDLEIMENFKQFYRKEVVKILINDMEEGRKSNINVLQGIRMPHKAWENVKQPTIVSCFATCGFVNSPNILTSNDCVQGSVKNHFNLDERFDDFVTFDDDVSATGLITDDNIVDSVLNRNTVDIVEEDEEVENVITAKEAKQMVEKLQTFFEAQEAITKNAFDSLASVA
ncbi:tigger transposable element-derived protein 6-like [Anastrepha ludens]|uniref:tigger transposable element-derived protein 6-like n=1 Tax=Anastrepha ludens TaxID=28586 RepID=UPI0023B025A9|nr:tigger transposable element-derived protein 6-like [Anastrepha ludens]